MPNLYIRDITPALHRALKIKAAKESTTVRALVIEALNLILSTSVKS